MADNIFFDTSDVVVTDIALRPYINLMPMCVPISQGRNVEKQFWKSKKPILERLMNRILVSGHKGRKHWRTSGVNTGKKQLAYNIVKQAFEIIAQRTKKNPIQVFVQAIENSSPREGIATIEYGGVRYPKAMDISPQRRIDLSLRWITQHAFIASATSKAKKKICETLAEEIMTTADGDIAKSASVKKRNDLERQSEASR